MKGKELIKKLRRAGVEVSARKGGTGHLVAKYRGKRTSIPFHGARDIDPRFIKALCGQIDLDWQQILER